MEKQLVTAGPLIVGLLLFLINAKPRVVREEVPVQGKTMVVGTEYRYKLVFLSPKLALAIVFLFAAVEFVRTHFVGHFWN